MEFTYKAYGALLASLQSHGHRISSYHNYPHDHKCAILRHDVDVSLEKALECAKYENHRGVKATYFILLTSDFYNIASAKNTRIILEIKELGHEIGLHFDEKKYISDNVLDIPVLIETEIEIMSKILGFKITTVSMHRPSQETLAADYKLHHVVNAYAKVFLKDFKYVSDSRGCWREPVLGIIEGNEYDKLHILTHPFWYTETGMDVSELTKKFVNSANRVRYQQMADNIKDFYEFMNKGEVIDL